MDAINKKNHITYCTCKQSYGYNHKDEIKFQKQILKILKRKRLPKSLEVSWLEHILKEVKKRPDHDYSRKYDSFHSQHPLFF
jgi:hypothetical protein